jgi:hypothetical protein
MPSSERPEAEARAGSQRFEVALAIGSGAGERHRSTLRPRGGMPWR